MKKYLLILTAFFSNILTAQVLYTESFDTRTIGNLGTDTTGVIPGQGGWFTHTNVWTAPAPVLGSNTDYQIVAENGRGNILQMQCVVSNEHAKSSVFRTDLKTYWQQRLSGNDVLKFSFDHYADNTIDARYAERFEVNFYNNKDRVLFSTFIEAGWGTVNANIADKPNLNTFHRFTWSNKQNVILPNKTWVTIELYVDYNNSKVYYSIPSLNYTVAYSIIPLSADVLGENSGIPEKVSITIDKMTVNADYIRKIDNINFSAQNTVPVVTVGVNEFLSNSFNLYPNPAINIVNITNTENMLIDQVTIYDIAGKQLSNHTFNNETEIQLNVENLTSGTYMLYLQTNEGTAVKKLVKK